jgi:DNA-binding MarR family transcriptional regulator
MGMATGTDRTLEDSVSMDAARKLASCVALFSRATGRALAKWEMTWPQAVSLLILRERAEPTNATKLVEELGLGRTAMTAVVDRLERRGWVERKPHPRDRRVALLDLTSSGRQVADEAAVVVRSLSEDFMRQAKPGTRFDAMTARIVARLR